MTCGANEEFPRSFFNSGKSLQRIYQEKAKFSETYFKMEYFDCLADQNVIFFSSKWGNNKPYIICRQLHQSQKSNHDENADIENKNENEGERSELQIGIFQQPSSISNPDISKEIIGFKIIHSTELTIKFELTEVQTSKNTNDDLFMDQNNYQMPLNLKLSLKLYECQWKAQSNWVSVGGKKFEVNLLSERIFEFDNGEIQTALAGNSNQVIQELRLIGENKEYLVLLVDEAENDNDEEDGHKPLKGGLSLAVFQIDYD